MHPKYPFLAVYINEYGGSESSTFNTQELAVKWLQTVADDTNNFGTMLVVGPGYEVTRYKFERVVTIVKVED